MRHVFVETNWVVAYAAPEHRQVPDARRLLTRALAGEIRLHLPSICLTEGRETIRRRCQPRSEADALRAYVTWALANGRMTEADAAVVRRTLDAFEQKVRQELTALPETLASLARQPDAIEIFPLNEDMLERAVSLGTTDLNLDPFDQAVLAAVLSRGGGLRDRGERDVCFCELDRDLQPWDSQGGAKRTLIRLYDEARVWVYGDFALQAPECPADW